MRRMGIGLGIGINRSNYAQGIFGAYQSRVTADGGVTEAGACVDAVSSLLQSASLLLIPSGYKGGKAYAEIPTNGNGDLTWTRASTALRTNSSGLLESMGSGVPRLSYMYGSCPALLLEPQRTNLALYSEQLSDVTWGKIFCSVTANSTTSPDGNTTADTFTADGSNNQHYVVGSTSGTVTSGSSYTYTIYAKKNTNNFIQLWISNTFGGMFANFDLNNGVVGTLGTGGTGSNPTSSITSVGNGWYRCSMTFVPTTTSAVGLLVAMTTSASAVRAEANTLSTSVFLWGAQLELGAYSTTYIPTTTASATRIADSFSRNNIYTNGLITSSGGTWFVELRGNVPYTRDASGSFFIDSQNGGLGNGFNIRNVGTPNQRFVIVKYVSFASSNLYFTLTDTVKIAIKWNGTTADVFVNGTKQVSGTSFTTTNMDFFGANGNDQPKFIQQMALYPSPLSDTDCTTLTTL
jgi:hypothetical protein